MFGKPTASTQVIAAEYRVALFTWQAPTAAEMAAVTQALGPAASNVQFISGSLQLVNFLRSFFVLV